jgi:hypothetical protein
VRVVLALLAVLVVGVSTAAGAEPERVTIAADPLIARWPSGTSLAGRVSNGKAGEEVKLEAKQCPYRSFDTLAMIQTTDGGAWVAGTDVAGKTTFRARWGETLSDAVVVLARPHLVLSQRSRRQFRAVLLLAAQANGKRLLLQRFDADDRIWSTVRTIAFRSASTGWPQMTFSANVGRGATLRLTLPRAQAQPCYLGGYSNILTT